MSDVGGPAFPRAATEVMMQADEFAEKGMTLLDYFAGQAVPALFNALVEAAKVGSTHVPDDDAALAALAYGLAAAMVAEKRRREAQP